MKVVFKCLIIFALTAHVGSPSEAKVEILEILERVPFAEGHHFGSSGPYERIRGRLHYAVDPHNVSNELVADLVLAPRDSRGMVKFSGDFLNTDSLEN